jgi:lipopolysaccharide assembly outer membrane protein LptD (OstA)
MKKAITRSLYIFLFLIFSQPIFAIEVEHIEAKSIEKPVQETQINPYEGGIEIPNPFEKKIVPEKPEVQKQKSEISLNSDEVFYNQETNEIEAVGNVSILAKPDNTKITAKRAVFSRSNKKLKISCLSRGTPAFGRIGYSLSVFRIFPKLI